MDPKDLLSSMLGSGNKKVSSMHPIHIHTYIHMYTHAYIYTHVHTYIHIHIHTFTHIHMHTCTHIQVSEVELS